MPLNSTQLAAEADDFPELSKENWQFRRRFLAIFKRPMTRASARVRARGTGAMVKASILLFMVVMLATSPVARADIVYLPTDQGAERFHRAAAVPAALSLLSYFETEERQTFCGPTSLSIALDSMGIAAPTPPEFFPYHLLTQDAVFTPQNLAVKSYARVEASGLTLDELGKFAANLGVATDVIHAADLAPEALRSRLREALNDMDKRVIVNYSRVALGQEGAGHISPLAAYDAESDSFLVLDVARYKYTPAWVSFDLLLAGMRLVDPDSRLSRGALIVSRLKP